MESHPHHNGFPSQNKITRRRKAKKVQSAKVSSFKALGRNPERLQREGVEWVRVLSPPKTDISTTHDADPDADADGDDENQVNEEDDDLIKRYFSGISSAGSSISWAEDAMESEFTTQLMKLWEDIETVCAGGDRPEKMSNAVYDECLEWKRAFPNPNNHRFISRYQNDGDISPVKSPTLLDESVGGNDDSSYSLLVNSPSFLFTTNNGKDRKDDDDAFDQNLQLLQTNFRELNCATPRPNIRKATEYVNAWLSECQNSSYSVPADMDHQQHQHHQELPELSSESHENFSRRTSPFMSSINNASNNDLLTFKNSTANNTGIGGRSNLRSSSYSQHHHNYSKYVGDSSIDPDKFFTSRDEIPSSRQAPLNFDLNLRDNRTSFMELSDSLVGDERSASLSTTADTDTLAEIVSRRSNFRVQRPISSRIRDHTITPIATGSTLISASSTFGHHRHYIGNILNQKDNRFRDFSSSTLNSSSHFTQNADNNGFVPLGNNAKYPDSSNNASSVSPTSSIKMSSGMMNRIHSGISIKEVYNRSTINSQYYYGRSRQSQQQAQAPWSRHSEEDNAW